MSDVKKEGFQVEELDDQDLDAVTGGGGLDISCNDDCPENSGNCVAGCSCTTPEIQ